MPTASFSTRSPKHAAILALVLSRTLTGCGQSTEPTGGGGPVASLTLSPASVILATTGHVRITATARTAAGAPVPDANTTWTSDSPAVTVSPDGVVRGVSPGRAIIKAIASGVTAEATVQVMNASPGSLAVVPSAPTLSLGQVVQAQAVAFDPDGVGAVASGVAWTAGEPAVVAVDALGVVTAAGPGNAAITATVDGRSASAAVTVVAFTSIATTGLSEGVDPCDCRPELVPDRNSNTAICAVTTTDQLYCAGKGYGPMAVPVAPSQRFRSVVSGGWNSFCGLTSDGAPYCWTVGRGPEPVPTSPRFASIAPAGADKDGAISGCGLTAEGEAYCWGAGGGRIGNGSFAPSPLPVAVATSETFVETVSNQSSTCARTDLGKVFCWGANSIGQLGIGNSTHSTAAPVAIQSSLTFARIIAAGEHSTCAITADTHNLYCWGDMETQASFAGGRCGPNSHPCSTVPTEIPTELRFTDFAPVKGPGFSAGQCALTTDGSVACWGVSYWGADQFGMQSRALPMCGLYPCLNEPTVTMANAGFTKLAGMSGNLCAIHTSGRALCWGPNVAGQLTDRTVTVGTPKPTVFAIDPTR